MAPNVLVFTRHGEKPGDGKPPHGVNPRGEHDDHSLSVEGWVRAGGLASIFAGIVILGNAPCFAILRFNRVRILRVLENGSTR